MGRYTLRRLLQLVPVLLGTTFLIYWMVWSLPGDPFAGKCGDRPCPDSYINAAREKFNLNDPLLVQYAKFMGGMVQGNFGETLSGRDAIDVIAQAIPITIKLAIVALVLEALIGLGAGVLTGLRRTGFLDNLVLLSTLLLIAIPIFVSGFLAQFLFGVKWGIVNPTVSFEAPWSELLLPGFILATASIAYVARLTRTSIAENSRADYVRTATAKGLTRSRVVGVHLLRNSLIPVVTFLGADLGALMGGAIVTEGIFNIPGVGGTLFRAIRAHESSTVVPLVTFLVLVYLLMTLLVDLFYAVLDPRIRYE